MDKNTKISIREMKVEDILHLENIELPKFQRNIKWKNSLRQDLIDSIKKEYPIGVFTLFSIDGKLYIIDGLQRFSTLQLFISKPKEIFGWNRLRKEAFFNNEFEMFLENNITQKKKIISAVKNWYEADFDEKKDSFMNFYNNYAKNLEIPDDEIEKLYKLVTEAFSIKSISMPVITYSGSWGEAAEIFEKMNTGSVNLTKYEIYAALWSNMIINDLDEKYKENIDTKYKELENIIEYDNAKYTIFDLFVALSIELTKISGIENVVPKLKYEKTNGRMQYRKDELSFEILSNIIKRNPLKVYDFVKDTTDNELSTMQLSEFILEVGSKVEKILNLYIKKNLKFEYYYETLFMINVLFYAKYEVKDYVIYDREDIDNKTISMVVKFMEEAIPEFEWFRNEKRQVAFLENINKLIEEFYKCGDHRKKNLEYMFEKYLK